MRFRDLLLESKDVDYVKTRVSAKLFDMIDEEFETKLWSWHRQPLIDSGAGSPFKYASSMPTSYTDKQYAALTKEVVKSKFKRTWEEDKNRMWSLLAHYLKDYDYIELNLDEIKRAGVTYKDVDERKLFRKY